MKTFDALFRLKKIAVVNGDLLSIGGNGVPSNFHNAEIFFAFNASMFVTEQALFVDGGYSAK